MLLRGSTLCLALLIALLAWAVWPQGTRAFSTGTPAPEIIGGPWINSNSLTLGDLKSRVVLIEFWTYG